VREHDSGHGALMPPTFEKLNGFALRFRVKLERRRQKNTERWSHGSNSEIGKQYDVLRGSRIDVAVQDAP
jgi:hypothetical protein